MSIVIPTLNAAACIEACLTSIADQALCEVEVIVVDQSSTDTTQEIAARLGATVITVPPPQHYTPPTASRNVGARAARGALLYHLDSDMWLSPGLLREAIDLLSPPSTTGAAVVHEQDETGGFWSRCKALERQCYWGDDAIESARLVRRDVFEQVGGYDESISSGEDFDIHRRYQAVTTVGAVTSVVHHDLTQLDLRRTLSKKYQYGKTAALYFDKHGESGTHLLATQLAAFGRNRRRLLSHPLLALAMLALKGLEFAAGGLGAVSSRLPDWRR